MTATALRPLTRERAEQAALQPHGPPARASRLRVDGKFFARNGVRVHMRGVTYGPFASDDAGEPFPEPRRVIADFAAMRAAGIDAIRTYHRPPPRVLDLANEAGISIVIDVPWLKHLCFLDRAKAQSRARYLIRETAALGRRFPCVAAISIGNEIPPNVVRWHGRRRVQRFLGELCDIAKQADPDGLVTYANFPSTEYLELPFLDYATFNV